ncbi:MAG: glycoside hydrolase family 9 protein [Ignavibacteria bacterium]
MKKVKLIIQSISIFLIGFLSLISNKTFCQETKLKLNDLEYFEASGLNVFVFSNQYTGYFFDEKTAGIELIHHGVRTATGGAVRLRSTPEQWDQIPMVGERNVDKENNGIEVLLRYDDYNFDSRVVVKAKGEGVVISVVLDKPLPKELEGRAGFNMEFLPASYFEKSFLIDGKPGTFPLYPSGPMEVKPVGSKVKQFVGHSTFDDHGRSEYVDPKPIAAGKTLVMAPNDPERFVEIKSIDGELMLYDGRNLAQNGWYVVRTLIPANKTGKVVEWHLTANTIENWRRKPVISYSQVGYHPDQKKVAVIELDKNDTPLKTASLIQVNADGNHVEKLTADVKEWGQFLRYNYVRFDFTNVKDPGLYLIKYGNQETKTFSICTDVYKNIWHQTLSVWFPVQMDHMFINEAYRVWHGAAHLDDARQAPLNHRHFDGYSMGDSTDSPYKPGEHIPGLNIGGWFDAGDFDIRTGSHCNTVISLTQSWEHFGLKHDETLVDQENRYVDIHHPDGKPDILQQVEHGALALIAQHRAFGRAINGIIVPELHQYHHLGDGSTMTDNMIYNSAMEMYESNGLESGKPDDRWAFTNKSPWNNYYSIGALAAASRALKGYNDFLADECLTAAKNAWIKEHEESGWEIERKNMWWHFESTELTAALELLIASNDEQYTERFNQLVWSALDNALSRTIGKAVMAIPYFDETYKDKLINYVEKYKNECDKFSKENPYGVLIGRRPWAGNPELVAWSLTNYHVHKAFPEIFSPEYTLRGLNYVLGCHPGSNISFVSGVGTHSKKVAYGNNRADFSFIAGGVVPGVLMLKPDFPENKEDWPFFWGENEYVIDICAEYIFLSNAVNELLNGSKK